MTKAEQWRKERKAQYKDIAEYMAAIGRLDPECKFKKTDLGAVIIFSDGSQHRMGAA